MLLISCICCLEDLRANDNGVWVHGGKPQRQYMVEFDESHCEVVSATPIDSEEGVAAENLFTSIRLYHHHKTTPQFQRRISYVQDCSKQVVHYAVVQYLFDDGNMPPHGNAKRSSTSHRRTQSSTLKKIKQLKAKPKVVVSEVHKEMGGSIEARSASELPRNRQVYNAQQQLSTSSATHSTASGSSRSDPLIRQCKEEMDASLLDLLALIPLQAVFLHQNLSCTDLAESCVLLVWTRH